METLENRLLEAAAQGDVNSLRTLLQQDPILLDRVIVNNFSDTPMHIAAILGHANFVREILTSRPEFARELNQHRSSPLHLASGKGHVEVVRALLSADAQMCVARDKNGFTPLHLAIIKGRIDVIQELINKAEASATGVTTLDHGHTVLHLCVKYYQLEALKLLLRTISDIQDLINSTDNDGNTSLHLAVCEKQVEAVESLLEIPGIQVNVENVGGLTPMDILIRSRKDVRDEKIEKYLRRAGAAPGSTENNSSIHISGTRAGQGPTPNKKRGNIWQRMFKHRKRRKDRFDEKRSSLMVVAILIATILFQVVANPPGGLWQANGKDSYGRPYAAGSSIYAHEKPDGYEKFLIFNTTGFIASLSIILLLMSGLRVSRTFMWILMVITWIAITSVALVYLHSIRAVTTEENEKKPLVLTTEANEKKTFIVMIVVVYVWICLMALLLIAHTIRLIIKLVSKLIRCCSARTRTSASTTAPHATA